MTKQEFVDSAMAEIESAFPSFDQNSVLTPIMEQVKKSFLYKVRGRLEAAYDAGMNAVSEAVIKDQANWAFPLLTGLGGFAVGWMTKK